MSHINGLERTGIHPHVFQEYDFLIEKAEMHHSTIKLTTQLGEFSVKKTKMKPDQLDRMIEVLGYLDTQNFLVNQIVKNKFGDPYIPVKDGLVYVKKWVEGKHLKLNSHPHFLAAIMVMAKLHKLGLNFSPRNSSHYPSMNEIQILNTWKQRMIWIKKYHKQLKRKSGLTTFEHVLSTYIPFLKDWAEEAIEQLEQWVIEYHSIRDLRRTICHGNYHHRNLILHQEKIVVLDFHGVSYDTPVRDIAPFIRRYILNKENRTWAFEWLEAYQNIMPLNQAEKSLLAIFLLFPERMFSFIKKYEEKGKHGSEEHDLKKLQVRWAQMRELIWFIDQYLK
ncbi:phosphotransferase [Tepidibacillus sp. LV47]|uniref:phosphotransferase n=1 Tax=Tepidibacillus sp. LV47 TaxID=3398228 RepID=UPI003AAC92C0